MSMQALVFTAPSRVELLEVDEPVVGPEDVLVHVRAVGICGSELHGIRKPGFRVPPLIMGHEFAGVTEAGDEVIVNPILSCGACDLCKRGLAQVCRNRRILGIHRAGAFAERVAVPRSALHPRPAGTSWAKAAMVEPAATALHAWELAGAPAGAKVGIIGAGTIGLVSLLAARDGGAAAVDVADRADGRLRVAGELGADTIGSELAGEYDVIIDAVGGAATHAQSVDRLRPGGTAVWLGLAEAEPGFDGQAIVRTEKRVIGSFAYTDEEFGRATHAVRGWNVDWATSHPLADGVSVFTALMEGATEPVKALLRPGAWEPGPPG